MSDPGQVATLGEKVELRRDVTIWGSYTWGYADVGADIYVALGLVIGAAQGGAPLAFALAGLVYILDVLSASWASLTIASSHWLCGAKRPLSPTVIRFWPPVMISSL